MLQMVQIRIVPPVVNTPQGAFKQSWKKIIYIQHQLESDVWKNQTEIRHVLKSNGETVLLRYCFRVFQITK